VLDVLGEDRDRLDPLLHNTDADRAPRRPNYEYLPTEVTLELDGRALPGQTPRDLARELRELAADLLISRSSMESLLRAPSPT
jgi:hypothetical protein